MARRHSRRPNHHRLRSAFHPFPPRLGLKRVPPPGAYSAVPLPGPILSRSSALVTHRHVSHIGVPGCPSRPHLCVLIMWAWISPSLKISDLGRLSEQKTEH